jgi:hypothetical protein
MTGGAPAAALVAAEHSPPAYLHVALFGGIVAAALLVFGVSWWRRRHRDRTDRRT